MYRNRNYSYLANDVSALIPEFWANESLLILEEEMVMGGLVNRNFENQIAREGEIVHVDKPAEFETERITKDDNVTDQDAVAGGVDVALNQYIDVSFVLKDEDMRKSFNEVKVSLTLLRDSCRANYYTLSESRE